MRAGSLVLRPVITFPVGSSLAEAKKFFDQTQLSWVLLSGERDFLLLSRMVVEKAWQYQLEVELKELALEDFPRLSWQEELSSQKLRDLLAHPERKALVLKEGKPYGWLTPASVFWKGGPVPEKRPFPLPQEISFLWSSSRQLAQELETEVYLVGGAVRDFLLKNPVFDLDLVVTERPQEFAKRLAERLSGKMTKRSLFSTFKIELDPYQIDIAQARWEFYQAPAALPTTMPGPLFLDLYRRDFTINSMAVSLLNKEQSFLVDPLGGERDLKNRLLRVHHPLSFIDDPTRLFRAARYLVRLALEASSDTMKACALAIKTGVLSRLSPARLRNEWFRILKEPEPEKVLESLFSWGVLPSLYPGSDKLRPLLGRLFRFPASLEERYEALALLLSRAEEKIEVKFSLSPAKIQKLKKDLDSLLSRKGKFFSTRGEIFSFLSRFPPPVLLAGAVLSEELFSVIKEYWPERDLRPLLSGKDLQKMGVQPGPKLGEMLKRLKVAQWNGQVRDRKQAWAFLKKEFPDVFSA